MKRILILYSTTDGHTLKICQHLQQLIEGQGQQVTLLSINVAEQQDLVSFDKIVIGASIRYGKHQARVHDFVNNNEAVLNSKPSAFFTVNVVARKPDKNQPTTNPYLIKFLQQVRWQPKQLAVFAGKINYPKYRFWDKQIIRLIMWMTNGPTDPDTVVEYTDWHQVDAFAQRVCEME